MGEPINLQSTGLKVITSIQLVLVGIHLDLKVGLKFKVELKFSINKNHLNKLYLLQFEFGQICHLQVTRQNIWKM